MTKPQYTKNCVTLVAIPRLNAPHYTAILRARDLSRWLNSPVVGMTTTTSDALCLFEISIYVYGDHNDHNTGVTN